MNIILLVVIVFFSLFLLIELLSRIRYYNHKQRSVWERVKLIFLGKWLISDAISSPLYINEIGEALGVDQDFMLKILSLAADKNIDYIKSLFLGKTGKNVKYNYVPLIGFLPVPNQNFGHLKINSLGFRSENISFEKPKHVKRIILLGGSVAFGRTATSNENTIAYHLQRRLNTYSTKNNGYRWEVINLAVPAATSYQELIVLTKVGLRYEPDIVISLSGFNDVFHYLASKQLNEQVSLNKVKSAYDILFESQYGMMLFFYLLQKYFVSFHYLEYLAQSLRGEGKIEEKLSPYSYTIW